MATFIDLDAVLPGNQTLTVGSGSARNIIANLGGGNDTLVIDDAWTFTHKVTYDGQAGSDKLVGNNAGNTWQITSLASAAGSLTTGANNVVFTSVEVLNGGTGANPDVLQGENSARTWNLNTTQTYTDGTSTLTFSDFERLQGGSAADTFNVRQNTTLHLNGGAGADTFAFFLAAGNPVMLTGNIDGQAGADTLNYASSGPAIVRLTAQGGTDGFAGTDVNITGTFTNIDAITGSTGGADSLTGRDQAVTWELDGTNRYLEGSSELAFAGVENLVGGSAVDTFALSADHTGNLTGNGGADVFNFTAGTLTGNVTGDAGNDAFNLSGGAAVVGSVSGGAGDDVLTIAGAAGLSGAFAGGAGSDTLSYAGYGSAASVALTGLGATDGFGGTATATGGFSDLDALVGTAQTDTLTGRDVTATWEVDGSNRYLNGATALAFSAVENLVGGSAANTFTVTVAYVGDLTGTGGDDVFNISAALTGALRGGAGDDTFNLSGSGTASGNVEGAAGNDTLVLAGTSAVAGGYVGGTGTDTLSYAGRSAAAAVTLMGPAVADGYNGFAAGLAGGFDTVDVLVGSSNVDTLRGSLADSVWTLAATNTYNDGAGADNLGFTGFESLVGGAGTDQFNVLNNTAFAGNLDGGVGANVVDYGDASNTGGITFNISGRNTGSVTGAFTFTAVSTLKGGSGNDTFVFTADNARLTGTINGGGGTNALTYTGYTSAVRVNLAANLGTGAGAGLLNIQNVTGGAGNDLLIGNAAGNLLSGGAGNDVLIGGDGDDTLGGGAGNDLLIGGLGADALDGGADDDILIGGTTAYDNNIAALNALMAEWGRTTVPYDTRLARVLGTDAGGLNGSYALNAATVDDESTPATDSLTGGTGLDWFFSIVDTVNDQNAGGAETVTADY